MKWRFEDPVITKQFCAIMQTEIDFLSCFLLCWDNDLKMLNDYPNSDIVKYKLKLLVAALNGLYPHILEKANDYDIIQIVLYHLNDITGWRFRTSCKHWSTRTIVSIDEINAFIQKKYWRLQLAQANET